MLTKTRLINSLDKLPEQFSIDELVRPCCIYRKGATGLNDVSQGTIDAKEEASHELAKWLK